MRPFRCKRCEYLERNHDALGLAEEARRHARLSTIWAGVATAGAVASLVAQHWL